MTMNDPASGASAAGLRQSLKQRHMTLIAIGGTIGAGLFVGSGVVIHATGPAALVSFLLAGVLIMLVMRMLGEMAVAQPAVGSFYEYARIALGERAGFTIGWLYWYFWVIVVALEAVAGAGILRSWLLPGAPLWLLALILLVALTGTNLTSTRSYGEFEFWFSSIKVIAIVVFLGIGLTYIAGLWPHHPASLANLTAHGGFAPTGLGNVLAKAVPAVAFFTGVEIVTIAAAESREPARMVARATNSVVVRVLLFYVGSIFVVVAIRPWNSDQVLASPYVSGLRTMGIGAAATIMNGIILTAVCSCLNCGVYTTSRILFALTRHGDAPHSLIKTTRRGVPARAILLGTSVGYIAVIMAYVSPNQVFTFLVNSYGAIALFVYLLIAVSQVSLRRRFEREAPERLVLRMWLFPWLSYATIAGMAAVTLAMAFIGSTRSQFFVSLLSLLVVLVAYEVRRRRFAAAPPDVPVPRAKTPALE